MHDSLVYISQAPPQQGLFDIKTILNLAILIINIVFTLIFYRYRTKGERSYQAEFNFYDFLVLKNIPELVSLFKKTKNTFLNATNDGAKRFNDPESIIFIQSQIDEIYSIQTDFQSNLFHIFETYSPDFAKEINLIVEDYFDNITEKLSTIPVIKTEAKLDSVLSCLNSVYSQKLSSILQKIHHNKPRL